jgi:plastocyanin
MVVLTLIASLGVPDAAAQVQASVGAESKDKGNQALAFLPNELWIHAGDSVTWTFATTEVHTVTFLRTIPPPPQVRPPYMVGCPGTTPDGSAETSASCINSGPQVQGAPTYTVRFPTAGNFKLVCLVHVDMTGMVHVLDLSETLPHDQDFYDRQARNDRAALLSDGTRLERRGIELAERSFRGREGHEGEGADERHHERTSGEAVTAGISEIVSTTGGGVHTETVMRFLRDKTVVHVGDTVEWTNLGPIVPHTVTFGIEPATLALVMLPSGGVTEDSDGARHAVIGSPTEDVNSGFLIAAPQERVGLPQSPQTVTRFRVTFTSPGTYHYICALHDDLGMTGTITVVP